MDPPRPPTNVANFHIFRVDLIKLVSNVRPYVSPSTKVSSISMKFGM